MEEIKKLVSYLVTLSGVLGAAIAFLMALPFSNETITLITGVLAITISILVALIKFLKDINATINEKMVVA